MTHVGTTNLLNDPYHGNLIHIKLNDKTFRIYVGTALNKQADIVESVIKFPANALTETELIEIIKVLAPNWIHLIE
jgi:hypothetical protein